MSSPVLEWIEEGKAAARVNPLGEATMNSQTLAALVYACEKVYNERRKLVVRYRQLEQEQGQLRVRVDELAVPLDRLEDRLDR
jgi:hypothetical protein